MSNIRDLHAKRREQRRLQGIPVEDPVADDGVPDAIAESSRPKLSIGTLQAPELRNMMQSITAMGQAQLRRFDAAGVVVMLFDASGTSVMAIERPPRGGVTDDYIREACARIGATGQDEEG